MQNLRRYEARLNQYKINRMFVQNQKRVYLQMDGTRNISNNQILKRENNFGVKYEIMRKNIKGKQNDQGS